MPKTEKRASAQIAPGKECVSVPAHPDGDLRDMQRIADSMSSATTINQIADVLSDLAFSLMKADAGMMVLQLEEGGGFETALLERNSGATRTHIAWRPVQHSLPARLSDIACGKRTSLFPGPAEFVAAYPELTAVQGLMAGAVVITPIHFEGHAIGAVIVSYNSSSSKTPVVPRNLTIPFEIAASQCAQAIDRLRMSTKLKSRAELPAHDMYHTLHRVVDCIADSVCAFDLNRRVIAFNTACARLFLAAFGIEVRVGMGMMEPLLPWPVEQARFDAIWSRALQGEAFTFTRGYENENFPVQYFESSYSPILDEAGRVTGAVQVSRTVTDRVLAEQALKKSMAQCAEAQSVAKIGSWSLDVSDGKLEWSDEMYRVLECDPAKELPPLQELVERYEQENGDTQNDVISNAIKHAEPYDITSRVRLKGEKQKWVRRIGSVQTDDLGKVTRLFGVVMDITDRYLAEKALVRAEARLEEAQQVANVGSWELDVATGELQWSKEFMRVAERDPALGVPDYAELLSVYVSEDADRLDAAMQRAIVEGVGYELDIRRVTSAGKTRSFRAIGKPVTDEDGNIIKLTNTSMDITDHKELETQLRQVQKMETIGRFAGAIAHDFNNLLAIITCHTELVADSVLNSDEFHESISSIQNATTRAANLTRQLLTFSHKQANNPKVIQPNALLTGTAAMLRPLIGQTIELVTHFTPDGDNIFIDANQLEQVIVNLVVNARDAMPEGGKLVLQKEDVTLVEDIHRDLIPAGRYVLISVSDTGIGMTEEVQERLFEPFFTTKEKGKGTGLGLATVYGIVSQNKGYISVVSQLGIGTNFRVYLPAAEEAAESDVAISPDHSVNAATETILVVDDERMLREAVVKALKKQGYSLLEAENGRDALQVIDQFVGEVHLVVTDMMMPGIGGYELARRLRDKQPGAAVLLLSGSTEEFPATAADMCDALPILRKPFKSRDLINTVRMLLHGQTTEILTS